MAEQRTEAAAGERDAWQEQCEELTQKLECTQEALKEVTAEREALAGDVEDYEAKVWLRAAMCDACGRRNACKPLPCVRAMASGLDHAKVRATCPATCVCLPTHVHMCVWGECVSDWEPVHGMRKGLVASGVRWRTVAARLQCSKPVVGHEV